MYKRFLGVLAVAFLQFAAHAQEPVLRTTRATLDVRDGNRLRKGIWTVDPSLPLDVYRAQRSTTRKTVTFITDIDSMAFEVQPGRTYDFTILLNGKDACHTRISTEAESASRVPQIVGPVTIPFTLKKGKLHLEGRINDSSPLDMLFDTGADTTVLYPSGMKKGAELAFDGTALNVGTGGSVERNTSASNRLSVGGLRWNHEKVLYIEKQADAADGIVGFNVFEDKVVELDYDRKVLVIHDSLPSYVSSYSRLPISYVGGLAAVEGALLSGPTQAAGPLVIDTGGDGTLIVNQRMADSNGLFPILRSFGTRTLGGVGSGTVRVQAVLSPGFQLAGYTLKDVPVYVTPSSHEEASSAPGGALFLGVLSRFNTILDYQNDAAYFRPNSRFQDPFQLPGPPRSAILILAAIGALILSLLGVALLWARKRSGNG